MLSFALILFDNKDELLWEERNINEKLFLSKSFGTITSIVFSQIDTAKLEIWYSDDDVKPVHIRTMFGVRYREYEPFEVDIRFNTEDELMNMFPHFVSYYSFMIRTYVHENEIVLQLGYIYFTGFIGELSYGFVPKEIDLDDSLEIKGKYLIPLLNIESGFIHPKDAGFDCDDAPPLLKPCCRMNDLVNGIVLMKRWANRAKARVEVWKKFDISWDLSSIIMSYT